MAFLTQKAFGDRAGVSRQRISKMCQLGHLTVRPDGKLDTEDKTNSNYLLKKERPDGLKEIDLKKGIKPKTGKKNKTPPKNKDKNNEGMTYDEAETILEGIPEDLQGMSKHDLDRMKIAVGVLKERLNYDEKRGMFIDRKIIERTFEDLYQIDRQEFLESPASISPRICQDIFETNDPELMTKVSELLTNEFHKVQSHIKSALDKNLEEMKIELAEV